MNIIQKQDIEKFADSFMLGNELKNCTFLITGATGLIGSTLIHCLLALGQSIKVIAPVRNKAKAEFILEDIARQITIIECDILSYDYTIVGRVDYIVHCAAPTASRFFIEKPVETFNIIVNGTRRLLEYSRNISIKGMVFLSSLEVYGEIHDDSIPVTEDMQGYLNPLNVRSSYPMAKRASENLCALYAKEYNIPVKIARLTQTTGAGIAKNDNRVFTQFVRLAVNNQDIVLHTNGTSSRPYCYTTDAISAILYILLKGMSREAYNVANDETYISARGIVEYLQKNFFSTINVMIDNRDNELYAPETKQRLCTEKLKSLGWEPLISKYDMFNRLINYFKS